MGLRGGWAAGPGQLLGTSFEEGLTAPDGRTDTEPVCQPGRPSSHCPLCVLAPGGGF